MDYEAFFQELKRGEIRRLYLFEGEEEYTKESALKALREKAVDPAMAAMNESVLIDPKPDALIAACETLPAFDKRRIVIVKDSALFTRASKEEKPDEETAKAPAARGKSAGGDLAEYLTRLPGYICLVFYVRGQAGGGKKLLNIIREMGGLVSFEKLDKARLVKWIARELKGYGKQIDRGTAEQLLFACGDDMLVLQNEIGKLAAHAGDSEAVTAEDVEAAVSKSAEYRVFDLADRVAGGKAAQALSLLREMLQGGERRLMLLSLLQRQYRQLLFVKIMLEEGQGQSAIAARLGIPPFVVRRMGEMVQRQTADSLKEAYLGCVNQEYMIKSGQISEAGSLEQLILNLLALQRKGGRNLVKAEP